MRLPVVKPLYLFLKTLGFPVVWEISVGSVLFRNQEGVREYLLLHYPSGHYDFPKGHMEKGETEEETLRRETREETSIDDIAVFPFRMSVKYFYAARGSEGERRKREGRGTWIFKRVHYYPAETQTKDVTISYEHSGFVWKEYCEAEEMLTFDNAKRVLRETEAFLKTSSDQKRRS